MSSLLLYIESWICDTTKWTQVSCEKFDVLDTHDQIATDTDDIKYTLGKSRYLRCQNCLLPKIQSDLKCDEDQDHATNDDFGDLEPTDVDVSDEDDGDNEAVDKEESEDDDDDGDAVKWQRGMERREIKLSSKWFMLVTIGL